MTTIVDTTGEQRPAWIGSLFSGHGGLDDAVTAVTGGRLAWHCDNDPAASTVLAHHHPDTPNLGDITTVDWTQVTPVDILTGGFPCTDISSAGRQAGLHPGTRSGLWFHMADAISVLRPRLVVIENVRNLLSVNAHGHVELCPWCVGDQADDCVRALGTVLADLADLGYDAVWCGLRAADVGAPHLRFRVFIAAADTRRGRRRTQQQDLREWPPNTDGCAAADSARSRPQRAEPARGHQLSARSSAADSDSAVGTESRCIGSAAAQSIESQALPGAGRSRGTPAADADDIGPVRDRHSRRRRSGPTNHGPGPVAHAQSQRRGERRAEHAQPQGRARPALPGDEHPSPVTDWSQYEPAIRRWETILGRPAPNPTVAGQRGGRKLSPWFVEWMMGLPEGHVTAVPGLSINDMLRLLGNGVVPQQGIAALQWLLPHLTTPTGDVTTSSERDAA